MNIIFFMLTNELNIRYLKNLMCTVIQNGNLDFTPEYLGCITLVLLGNYFPITWEMLWDHLWMNGMSWMTLIWLWNDFDVTLEWLWDNCKMTSEWLYHDFKWPPSIVFFPREFRKWRFCVCMVYERSWKGENKGNWGPVWVLRLVHGCRLDKGSCRNLICNHFSRKL